MIKAEEQLEISEADKAAHAFQTLYPEFCDKIEELSNRQLKRVTVALMTYPLEKAPNMSYAQERELFELGLKLSEARQTMLIAFSKMKEDEINEMMKETIAVDAAIEKEVASNE
jgi:hypothetical protein